MQYKLIAADMDGTLLDSNKTISQKNLTAIRQALELGVIFTISTGRPVQGVQRYQETLQLETPIITYNGGVIVTPCGSEVLYQRNMEPESAAAVIRHGQDFDASMCIWADNKLYILREDERTIQYAKSAGGAIRIQGDEIKEVIRRGIAKILWYDEPSKIEAFQETLRRTPLRNVVYCTSTPSFLEFVDHHVSKGQGLQFLGEHHGISAAEMIAIGDGMNDLTMLEYAGLGVAMENAPEAVKAAADVITASNEDDGVAQVIERFILQ